MPEGDTIFFLAERMRLQLVGRTLRHVWLREVSGASAVEGAEVTAVRSVGKHLLIDLEKADAPNRILRSHLGMNGSWRTLRRPVPRNPACRIAFRIEGGPELRCEEAAQVEVFLARDEVRHPALSRLGPDLLGEHDLDAVVARARARSPEDLAALLLDQGTAAGLGNVYKSELLFRAGLHPLLPVSAVDDATLRRLFEDGAQLLAANSRRSRRVTTLGPRGARARVRGIDHFVYGRGGRPCVLCGTRVQGMRQGPLVRPTWWCPRCQPPARPASAPRGM